MLRDLNLVRHTRRDALILVGGDEAVARTPALASGDWIMATARCHGSDYREAVSAVRPYYDAS